MKGDVFVPQSADGVAQLLRSLPFRELVTFAEAMRDCADLCDGCREKARALPGAGDGPLPHYDEQKRQEAAEDMRRRHSKRHTETAS